MRRPSRKLAPECRPEEAAFLQSIVDNPHDEGLWLILADWLEEHDDPRRAELLRLHRQLIATCCEPEKHLERDSQQTRIVQLLTEGVRPAVPRQTLILGEGVDMTFAWIPPGSFLMGSPEGEEGRKEDEVRHRVTLTRGFWLALTPVTQDQWQAVMGHNPSHLKGTDLPVEPISSEECQEFCCQLGEQEGKLIALPTEAEWEYACRAGTTTPFFFGESLGKKQANCDASVGKTTVVGSYPCNAWRLYDLHGNVWEWCHDWVRGGYTRKPVRDPSGPATGDARVLRGGSWSTPAKDCRAASRSWNLPEVRHSNGGFRPAFRPS